MNRDSKLIYLLYALISVAFCAPLFAHPTGVGTLDWDQHQFYYAQVIKNVVEYAQAPASANESATNHVNSAFDISGARAGGCDFASIAASCRCMRLRS